MSMFGIYFFFITAFWDYIRTLTCRAKATTVTQDSLQMFSKILTLFIIGLIVLLGILTVLRLTPVWDRLLSSGDFEPTDFTNLTTSSNPNWYLLCPEGYCPQASKTKTAPLFDLSRDELAARLKDIIKAEENVDIRFEDEKSLDVVIRTPFMRWPDLISLEIVELTEGKSSFALFSRSIYGRKDFAANKNRVEKWLAALAQ
jgi:uncharacterized protein (DUF1499 family)